MKNEEFRIQNSELQMEQSRPSSMLQRRPMSCAPRSSSLVLSFFILHSSFFIFVSPLPALEFSRDGITVDITYAPASVCLDQDFELTFTLSYPENKIATLPPDFTDRFEGLAIEGEYEGETLTANGRILKTLHLRTRPDPTATEYRLAPFAVRYGAKGGVTSQWFPTKPIVFPQEPLLGPGEAPPTDIDVTLKKKWIPPSWRDMGRWTLMALGAVVAGSAVYFIFRKIQRKIRVLRMAPRERALHELRELLAKRLPEKGRVKEFYVRLTGIVRHYVERRHNVRAPELTTEEFLHEASKHPAFTPETVARLKDFLNAADMVKFAGITASVETITHSTDSAKQYIEAEKN